MKTKKLLALLLTGLLATFALAGCGGDEEEVVEESAVTEEVSAPEESVEAEASDEMVSDETFADLQENYALLVDLYNSVVDLYSSEDVAADEDINEALSESKDIIEEMGEISQEDMTEAHAVELNEIMLDLVDVLDLAVDSMQES